MLRRLIQVEDKTDLDYAAGGDEENDKDDKQGKEDKKSNPKKKKQEGGAEEEQIEVWISCCFLLTSVWFASSTSITTWASAQLHSHLAFSFTTVGRGG